MLEDENQNKTFYSIIEWFNMQVFIYKKIQKKILCGNLYTGGPPLTRFSLLRNPLPRFLSYVRASYSDFGLKYFFFSSNKATNPDNNSPKEKTESTDDEGGPAKTTLNPIYIPPRTSKVISSIMGKIEMAKNIHLQMGIVILFKHLFCQT